jgi:hypothetical protein
VLSNLSELFKQRHHGYLTVSLFLLLLIPIFGKAPYLEEMLAAGALTTVFLSGFLATLNRKDRVVYLLLGLPAVGLTWLRLLFDYQGVTQGWLIAFILFFIVVAVRVFRNLLQQARVDAQSIFGAVSIYLLLGFIGSFVFALVVLFDPSTFSTTLSFSELIYFSFVTMSTLGYGDITPDSSTGQSLSVLLAVVGQLYLTIVIALFVGKYLQHRNEDREDTPV